MLEEGLIVSRNLEYQGLPGWKASAMLSEYSSSDAKTFLPIKALYETVY